MFGVTRAEEGARGAYIAGVLHYIHTELPKPLECTIARLGQ